MKFSLKNIVSFIVVLLTSYSFSSCTDKEEPVRLPVDILGVWSPNQDNYLEFCEENIVHRLEVKYQDSESIGLWVKDVYYYEPGYNLVIYLSGEKDADVFQIVDLTETQLTWCWVDQVEATDTESIGKVIGDIIKKAQDGYKLNPALYQSFQKIPQNEFFRILEGLDINYPWI